MFMNSYEDDGSVSDSSILLLRRWGTKERSAHDSAAMAILEEADMRLEEKPERYVTLGICLVRVGVVSLILYCLQTEPLRLGIIHTVYIFQ